MRTHLSALIRLSSLVLLLACIPRGMRAQTEWKSFGNLFDGRNGFEAIALDDNNVLVAGGYVRTLPLFGGLPMKTAELIHLRERTVTTTGSMTISRAEFVALRKPDSNVIVLGGVTLVSNQLALTAVCELYDHVTGTWSAIGNLRHARYRHAAAFLNDHEILVVGGEDLSGNSTESAEIFNFVTGVSRDVHNYPSQISESRMARSDSGSVLVFGGKTGNRLSPRVSDIYRYDSTGDKWVKTGQLPDAVSAPELLKLWDGRLALTGGTTGDKSYSKQVVVEKKLSFTTLNPMSNPRGVHGMAQWSADTLLAIAGLDLNDTTRRTVDMIDLKSGQVSAGPPLQVRRQLLRAVALPIRNTDGSVAGSRVLAISGLDSTIRNITSIEILEPSCAAVIAPVGSLTFCAGDSVRLDAGPGYTSYLWSNGKTTQSIVVTSGGNYTVTTTDSSGCSGTSAPVAVKVAPIPKPNISPGGPLSLCAGDSASVDGGAGFARYIWSTGDTTRKITVRETGEYRLMVISNEGCVGFDTMNIVVNPLPPVPTITRSGDTLIASQAVSYRWFLGNTPLGNGLTQRIIATQPGVYTVRIIDSNGCTAVSDPFTIAPLGVNGDGLSSTLRLLPLSGGRWLVAGNSSRELLLRAELVDVQGRTVMHWEWNVAGAFSRELSLADLPAGAYFLRLRSPMGTEVRQLVKE